MPQNAGAQAEQGRRPGDPGVSTSIEVATPGAADRVVETPTVTTGEVKIPVKTGEPTVAGTPTVKRPSPALATAEAQLLVAAGEGEVPAVEEETPGPDGISGPSEADKNRQADIRKAVANRDISQIQEFLAENSTGEPPKKEQPAVAATDQAVATGVTEEGGLNVAPPPVSETPAAPLNPLTTPPPPQAPPVTAAPQPGPPAEVFDGQGENRVLSSPQTPPSPAPVGPGPAEAPVVGPNGVEEAPMAENPTQFVDNFLNRKPMEEAGGPDKEVPGEIGKHVYQLLRLQDTVRNFRSDGSLSDSQLKKIIEEVLAMNDDAKTELSAGGGNG